MFYGTHKKFEYMYEILLQLFITQYNLYFWILIFHENIAHFPQHKKFQKYFTSKNLF